MDVRSSTHILIAVHSIRESDVAGHDKPKAEETIPDSEKGPC